MDIEYTGPTNAIETICDVHRRMYRELLKRDPKDPLIDELRTAFDMAKRMSRKLKEYKDSTLPPKR